MRPPRNNCYNYLAHLPLDFFPTRKTNKQNPKQNNKQKTNGYFFKTFFQSYILKAHFMVSKVHI